MILWKTKDTAFWKG